MDAYKYLLKNENAKWTVEKSSYWRDIRNFVQVIISFDFCPERKYEEQTVGYLYEGLRGFVGVKALDLADKSGTSVTILLTDESIKKLDRIERKNHNFGWSRHPEVPVYFLRKDETIELPALLDNE